MSSATSASAASSLPGAYVVHEHGGRELRRGGWGTLAGIAADRHVQHDEQAAVVRLSWPEHPGGWRAVCRWAVPVLIIVEGESDTIRIHVAAMYVPVPVACDRG